MSIRFAGSRFVHERRRRRLAQECGGVSVVAVDDDPSAGGDDAEAGLDPTTTLGHSPVSSIIRPQLWVHWTITVLCLAAWGGMMYLGDLAEQTDIGLKDILGLRSGRLTTFFSTIMLLWAGQLSLLIYWYRRKSRNDFAGRYRMWLWICGILQLFLTVAATGTHVPFSQYMQRLWPLDIPMYGLFCWLVPVSTLGLAVYRMLKIELKRHQSGQFLLNVAGGAALIAALSLIVGPLLPQRLADLLQIGSATLAHMGLATALLMHARYVVHISNEAPRRERRTQRLLAAARNAAGYVPRPKVSLPRLPKFARPKMPTRKVPSLPKMRLPQIGLPKVRLPKVTLPKMPQLRRPASAEGDDPSGGTKTKSKVKTQSASPAAAKGSKSPRKAESSHKTAQREETSQRHQVESGTNVTSRKKKPKPAAKASQQRVDVAETPKGPRQAPARRSLDDILTEYGSDEQIDAETLNGLSKKERRRLRKKQRELQRTG